MGRGEHADLTVGGQVSQARLCLVQEILVMKAVDQQKA